MRLVRKGQIPRAMSREEFRDRYPGAVKDPAHWAEWQSLECIEAIAWDGYTNDRK